MRQFLSRGGRVLLSAGLVAGALGVVNVSGAQAATCGLSYTYANVYATKSNNITYNMRNCGTFTLHSRVDLRNPITGFPDGPCETIYPGQTVTRTLNVPLYTYINGWYAC